MSTTENISLDDSAFLLSNLISCQDTLEDLQGITGLGISELLEIHIASMSRHIVPRSS